MSQSIIDNLNNVKSYFNNINNDQNKTLRKMRIEHGKAKKYQCDFMSSSRADTDFYIEVSENECLIYAIHVYIRKIVKMTSGVNQHISSTENTPLPSKIYSNDSNVVSLGLSTDKISDYRQTESINNLTEKKGKKALLKNSEISLDFSTPNNSVYNTENYTVNSESSMVRNIKNQYGGNMTSTEMLKKMYYNSDQSDGASTDVLKHILNYDKQRGGNDDDDTFKKNFKDITQPTLVLYWADWCGYSKAYKDAWKHIIDKLNIQFTDIRADYNEENKLVADKSGIEGFPTLIYYDGKGKCYNVEDKSPEGVFNFINNN
jgi:thiol-disulfide isomerase/thioredoxin